MKYKVVAFDWDGTLVDSIGHIIRSMKRAAEIMSLDLRSSDSVRNIIGLGMAEAVSMLYPNISDMDVEVFRGHYSEAFSTGAESMNLFPNATQLLRELSDVGVKLAVATGKSRRGLDAALQSTGLKQYFAIERCSDEAKSKPDPLMLNQIMTALNVEPHEVLMVGDTDFDMSMAKSAGVDRVGVSFGAQPRGRLEQYDPLGIIDDLSDLKGFLLHK